MPLIWLETTEANATFNAPSVALGASLDLIDAKASLFRKRGKNGTEIRVSDTS
jgi:hypothetical protein